MIRSPPVTIPRGRFKRRKRDLRRGAHATRADARTTSVVIEMATAGRTMRDELAKMDQDMMGHVMEHMK